MRSNRFAPSLQSYSYPYIIQSVYFGLPMDRKRSILQAIISEFIETAEPVGSQTIVLSYHFSVSPATIRNEMAALENEGFLYQPHTSAGRIPTDVGYRLYVDELVDYERAQREADKELQKVMRQLGLAKAREKIYDAVRILAHSTGNVSFATLPDSPRTFYLGVANVLKQPEFCHDPMRASQIVEVLEDDDNFINTLSRLNIKDDKVKIFIGKENIIPQIKSCAMIVSKYSLGGLHGFLGIMGSTRMKYPFNHAMVQNVRKLLTSGT